MKTVLNGWCSGKFGYRNRVNATTVAAMKEATAAMYGNLNRVACVSEGNRRIIQLYLI